MNMPKDLIPLGGGVFGRKGNNGFQLKISLRAESGDWSAIKEPNANGEIYISTSTARKILEVCEAIDAGLDPAGLADGLPEAEKQALIAQWRAEIAETT